MFASSIFIKFSSWISFELKRKKMFPIIWHVVEVNSETEQNQWHTAWKDLHKIRMRDNPKTKPSTFNWQSTLALAFGAIFISQQCFIVSYLAIRHADWLQLVEIWIRCWIYWWQNAINLDCNVIAFTSSVFIFFLCVDWGNKIGITMWGDWYLVTHKTKTFFWHSFASNVWWLTVMKIVRLMT